MSRQLFPRRLPPVFALACLIAGTASLAQTNVGSLSGTVTDPSGAVIPGATVTVHNPVSGLLRTSTTDSAGRFQFPNLPTNPYHVSVSAPGFAGSAQDIDIRSSVPVAITTALKVAAEGTTVTVESGNDLIEKDTSLHTDVDRDLFNKLPLESQSSALSSLVTLASPGVAADSNGLFHGLGDHASNSFSVDGQPITDQQSKVFSNQIPSNSVQSLEVISGAPPAEFGGKTSLVIEVTTRSGLNTPRPTGAISASYGTFGSATGAIDLGYGTAKAGNFFELDGLNTGRFLDPPEFVVFHDKGNEQNVFDRIDYQFTNRDSAHLDLNYSRSWFQTPNAYDNLNVGVTDPVANLPVGQTDQHSKIETYDIAPTYTRLIGIKGVFNFGPYVRRDAYNYYPSHNPFADNGPIQAQTIAQERTLLNAGIHTDLSYVTGVNTIKGGVQFSHTFLRENDSLSTVSTTYNSPCVDGNGNPLPGFTDPGQCAAAGDQPNPNFTPVLLPYDLTRGGGYLSFHGRADVKEIGLYVEDQIKTGNWLFNLGIRGDLYNGLTVARQAEPRLGLAYTFPKTNTVLRISYARTLESPFNENLVLSSLGCTNDVLAPLLACTPGVSSTLAPGFRNEFHAGFQQAFGSHLVVSGDYIWKYTHNAFDFSVLGNTPITFPIDWHNSKIPGFALRADLIPTHGVSAFVTMSSVTARFFPPQIAGAGATVGHSGYPFRIDHDERFNQTTHLSYQLPGEVSGRLFHSRTPIQAPWVGFNWRYDSGLTAGSTPCYSNPNDPNSNCAGTSLLLNGQPAVDVSGFTADQQFEAGLACNGVRATPTTPIPSPCLASQLTSTLLKIPAPGTEDADRNVARIAPRNLFDLSLGQDNLFAGERYKWSLRLTGVNITNKYALYNFLSTFSGTHYVTPRALNAELGFHF